MKKILYLLFVLAFVLPSMVNAATFNFSPNSGSFAPESTFNVVVYVKPNTGEEITTAKLSAAFSASGLEVVSFAQADGWIPLVAPGSDLIDNVEGKLIKTGGFPARVKESKQFGTITLKTKSVGTATLNTDEDSMLLDSANTNKYVSSAGANFTIVAPIPAPTPTTPTPEPSPTPTAPTAPATQTTPTSEPTEEEPVPVEEEVEEEAPVTQESSYADQLPVSQPAESQSLLASVSSVVTLGTDNVTVGLLFAVVVFALAGYSIYSIFKRARRKNTERLR